MYSDGMKQRFGVFAEFGLLDVRPFVFRHFHISAFLHEQSRAVGQLLKPLVVVMRKFSSHFHPPGVATSSVEHHRSASINDNERRITTLVA